MYCCFYYHNCSSYFILLIITKVSVLVHFIPVFQSQIYRSSNSQQASNPLRLPNTKRDTQITEYDVDDLPHSMLKLIPASQTDIYEIIANVQEYICINLH